MRVYSTQLLFVVVDVDIARGVFVLPQQQGGGERHSEGSKHGKQSLVPEIAIKFHSAF